MSLILNKLQVAASIFRSNLTSKVISARFIHPTLVKYNEEKNYNENAGKVVPPTKDRSVIIPVDISIKYLNSRAYKQTYGDDPVWKNYRRNFKGQFPPRKTRKMCIRGTEVSTGSPCPICRDEYLILDYRNIALLKQFISEHDGQILSYECTGLCQKAHKDLCVAIMKAMEYGLLIYDVPYRYYNYTEWKS